MSTQEIEHINAPLPSCKVNLMPFHLKYNGPAPISTYFMVEPAKETVGAPEDLASKAGTSQEYDQASMASGSQIQSNDGTKMEVDSINASSKDANADASCSLAQASGPSDMHVEAESVHSRFISTFRGRTIQGLNVELPEGYVGIVLKPREITLSAESNVTNGKERDDAENSDLGRGTRRSSRRKKNEEVKKDAEGEDLGDALDDVPADVTATQTFTPTASFSSFMLWHPDIPVDESRDEYYRSIMEWTQLASVLHRTE